MATIFSDDFETDLSGWTAEAGSPTLQAGTGYLATQALLMNAAGDAVVKGGFSETTIWCGFWFKASGSSSSTVHIVQFEKSGFHGSSLRLQNSTGKLDVMAANQTTVLDTVANSGLQDGDWHFVEVSCFAHNSSGVTICNIGGVEILNGTGDTRGSGGASIGGIEIYGHAADNFRLYDDFYIDDAEFHGAPAVAATGRVRGMSVHQINLTTDANGAVTAYSRAKVNGRVARVFVDIGTLADSTTTDIVVTGERTAEAVYTGTDLTADTLADPTTAAGVYVWQERLKVVVAQGGDTKTGQIWFVVIG